MRIVGADEPGVSLRLRAGQQHTIFLEKGDDGQAIKIVRDRVVRVDELSGGAFAAILDGRLEQGEWEPSPPLPNWKDQLNEQIARDNDPMYQIEQILAKQPNRDEDLDRLVSRFGFKLSLLEADEAKGEMVDETGQIVTDQVDRTELQGHSVLPKPKAGKKPTIEEII